eukprot:scaffold13782_cov26-Tisochrysis_lutea.AAC.6
MCAAPKSPPPSSRPAVSSCSRGRCATGRAECAAGARASTEQSAVGARESVAHQPAVASGSVLSIALICRVQLATASSSAWMRSRGAQPAPLTVSAGGGTGSRVLPCTCGEWWSCTQRVCASGAGGAASTAPGRRRHR